MTQARPRWITPLVILGYVVASNVALASQSRLWASIAVALFVALLVPAVSQPRWRWARIIIVAGGTLLTLGVVLARLPPVPLLLPPVVVPAALAWLFGQTLLGGREALVQRFARAVCAPEPLDAEHAAYARSVTVMWTWLLAGLAAGNFLLVICMVPGGLLHQFGFEPRWPVDAETFLWLINAVYVLVPVVMVAEFLVRLRRFPNYQLRNPLEFARRARERLPAVVAEIRRG